MLHERFPDKQKHDWMAECLKEVFQIRRGGGDNLDITIQEVFSKCKRKVNIAFLTEVKGWICLHASGLSEGQRAIVTAKTQGDLRLETVMAAMRSYFPDFKAPAKSSKLRNSAAYVVEGDREDPELGHGEQKADSKSEVFPGTDCEEAVHSRCL